MSWSMQSPWATRLREGAFTGPCSPKGYHRSWGRLLPGGRPLTPLPRYAQGTWPQGGGGGVLGAKSACTKIGPAVLSFFHTMGHGGGGVRGGGGYPLLLRWCTAILIRPLPAPPPPIPMTCGQGEPPPPTHTSTALAQRDDPVGPFCL